MTVETIWVAPGPPGPERGRYCEFCAWTALTPETREYCRIVPLRSKAAAYVAECTRMPGHDGPHVACAPGFSHAILSFRGLTESSAW